MIDRDPANLTDNFRDRLLAAISMANRESRTPTGQPKLPDFANWALYEGRRSTARQRALYAQGRSKPGKIVTYRKTSNHETGAAADVCWVDNLGDWRWDGPQWLWDILGHAARANGLVWGGDWHMRDLPHIEV